MQSTRAFRDVAKCCCATVLSIPLPPQQCPLIGSCGQRAATLGDGGGALRYRAVEQQPSPHDRPRRVYCARSPLGIAHAAVLLPVDRFAFVGSEHSSDANQLYRRQMN